MFALPFGVGGGDKGSWGLRDPETSWKLKALYQRGLWPGLTQECLTARIIKVNANKDQYLSPCEIRQESPVI